MILKIIKTGLFISFIIVLISSCKKDKLESLQEDVLGEYEYFTCFSGPHYVNDTSGLRWMTTCDLSTKKILVISKSNIFMEDVSRAYTLNSDSSFHFTSYTKDFNVGKFYKKDSITFRVLMGSATGAYYDYYGKKIK